MRKNETIAVIDIGSSAMRLLVAQSSSGEWKILDTAEQPLALGRDVFRRGSIDRRTTTRALDILKGFQELMAPYRVDRIVAIGTSALRESKNREMFIDRILLHTGIEIHVVDGVEANQLTWLAVREPLECALPSFKKYNSLIIEVGAGNTDLMVLKQGKISSSHALPIGTLRFLQQIEGRLGGNIGDLGGFFRNHAARTVKAMSYELGLARMSKLVAVGSDVRLVASRIGQQISDEVSVITRTAFRDFMSQIESYSMEEIIARLAVPWNEAELLYPALVIFDTFIGATRADEILVPSVSIRQGLLVSYASERSHLQEIYSTQVLAGARTLARHYHADMVHAEFVRKQALFLYDTLSVEIGLESGRYRLLLETAALLHDIGSYIAGTSHHKHGQYIIRNSEIFGLSASDREIVGHVVRYHRRAIPSFSHNLYMTLNRESRIIVQKLASILRVADALDRSHIQKVIITDLKVSDDRLVLNTVHRGDLSVEELSLSEKGNMFEDVFGLKPVLRSGDSEAVNRPEGASDA